MRNGRRDIKLDEEVKKDEKIKKVMRIAGWKNKRGGWER